MKQLTFLITAVFILATATLVNAQKGQRYNDQQSKRMQQECMIPDLTDEQESQIDDLRTEHWNKMQDYRADLAILRAELRKLHTADNLDEKAIDSKIEAIGKIKTQMHKAANHHHMAVREVLTDEQKDWFDRRGPRYGQSGFGSGHGCKGHRGHGFKSGSKCGYGHGGSKAKGQGRGMRQRDGSCRW